MKNIKTIWLLIAAIAWMTSCTSKNGDDKEMVFYGTHGDDVKTLDPAASYDAISWDIVSTIYETLYQYDYLADPYKISPLLAADFPKYSKDRLTVTIPIRRDVTYQDDPAFIETGGNGRKITAHDFIYGWKRLAIPAIQSQGLWIFDGKVAGMNAFHKKLVDSPKNKVHEYMEMPVIGLKALDDYTLQIKLVRPYPQLLYILTMPFTAPIPIEAVKMYGDPNGNLHHHPVGSGPFVLKKWARGHRIILERNPTYHTDFFPTKAHSRYEEMGFLEDAGKPIPFLDKVSIDIIKEQQPAWFNFLQGKLDRMTIPKDNFQQAITDQVDLTPEFKEKGIRLSIGSGTRFYYVSFNMKDPIVGKNKYLRQAISSAIDREQFIKLFTNGRGRKAVNALPPGIPDRPGNSRLKYDYNLTKASALLAKAGFPKGKGLSPIKFDMRSADSISRQMGEFFSQQLSKIGIPVQVIYNTFPAYLEKAKQGNLQVSYGGWQLDYPDAENVYQLLYGPNSAPGPNDSNFDHKEMNALYDKIAIMESGKKRAALIARMDSILQEECPWALLFYHTNYELVQGWLKNFRADEMILNRYKYFKIDKVYKKQKVGY